MIVDTGFLDETPPMYSPFCRSKTNLFIYHKKYINMECIAECDEGEGDDSGIVGTVSGVYETKNGPKVI